MSQTSEILNKMSELRKEVENFIVNTEHFIFYWIEEDEVKDFVKKNPEKYEDLIQLSVETIDDSSATVKIQLGTSGNSVIYRQCHLKTFKAYTEYQWNRFNGRIKELRIKQVQENLDYYRQRAAECEELLAGLTKSKK